LVEERLFEVYQKKLRERMNELADAVATGSAQTYDEYRKMVGVIEGLALAERELLDLIEALKKGEE
jgi:translation initiation factor 1 (eIF-1/SUI1)